MGDRNKPVSRYRAPLMALLVMASGALAGCSSVPDAVNPVEWYRGVSGWFESDEDQAQRGQAQTAAETAPPLPGANRDYPNLASVPERPKSVTSSEDRSRVSNGLVADRENARYAYTEPSRLSTTTAVPEPSPEPAAAPSTRTPAANEQASRTVVEQLEALPPPPAPPTAAAPPPAPPPAPVAPPPPAPQAAVPPPSAPVPATQLAVQPAAPPPVAAPQATRPVASSGRGSLLDQTYQAALAQQKAGTAVAPAYDAPMQNAAPPPSSSLPVPSNAAPLPSNGAAMPPAAARNASAIPRADSSKTAAGTPIPRSFVVHFKGGAADVAAADRGLLREVAQIYKSTNAPLRIVGHASHSTRERDGFGQQVTNLRISLQRAETVARELTRLGVPADAMTVTGVSDNEPLYDESTQAGIAGNRRAEIFFGP